MTPAQTAALALTDYIAQVESRVISPFESTKELPAGTRQFRAVIWHRGDDKESDHGAWTTHRSDTFAEAEELLADLEGRLLEAAEAAEEADDPSCQSCEGTGIGWPAQARCSSCGGSGIARLVKAHQ